MLPSITITHSMQSADCFTTRTAGAEGLSNDDISTLLLEPLPLEFASPTGYTDTTASGCCKELLLEAVSSFLVPPPVHSNNGSLASASKIIAAAIEVVSEEEGDLSLQQETTSTNGFFDESLRSFCWSTTDIETQEETAVQNHIISGSVISIMFDTKPKNNTDEMESSRRTSPCDNNFLPAANPSVVGRSWYQRYHELIEFKQEYGQCCVPVYWPQNPQLAQWVKRQRSQFKLRNEGRHSNMSDSRIQALDQIHFVWDSHSVFWEKRLEELKQFREEHGHCRVPTNYPQNQELAVWTKSQRHQFKLFCQDDKKSHITLERIQKLVKIGFAFTPRSSMKK
jgi:hypothetical protein